MANYDPYNNQNNQNQNQNPYQIQQNSDPYGNPYYDQGQNPQQMYQQQMLQQQAGRGMWGQQPQLNQQAGYGTGRVGAIDLNSVLVRSFAFMFLALLVTGITALLVANSAQNGGALGRLVYGTRYGFIGFLVLEFAVVIGANAAMRNNKTTLSAVLFFVYSIVNGLTLSVIFLAYELGSITSVFFASAGIFAVMALIGAFTKIDLSKLGVICIIGLFGIVIASLVNMFIGSKTMDTVICAIGVVVFVGLTAYDVQKIKKMAATNTGYDLNVLGLYGAMELYLDFINLFLYLLRLFGKSK